MVVWWFSRDGGGHVGFVVGQQGKWRFDGTRKSRISARFLHRGIRIFRWPKDILLDVQTAAAIRYALRF